MTIKVGGLPFFIRFSIKTKKINKKHNTTKNTQHNKNKVEKWRKK